MDLRIAQPITFRCGLTSPNRLVKAATAEGMANKNSSPGSDIHGPLGVWLPVAKANLQDWTACANVYKQHSAAAVVQISHPGRQSPLGAGSRGVFDKNLAPSDVGLDFARVASAVLFGTPILMTIGNIHDVICRFVDVARLSAQAGFSSVEIRAAHGFLLAQFLSPVSKKRPDDYGGSPAA
ncbi:unnamed protein product [Clonostachys rosea]|uniref:NADH:flavin oxidoreductase/NADH oxidase N-terminal domain-containing protein n=1 Tax=Bionectria ochroleuca TaxID=29856 RepID=A0ABY6U633_BIOOC|nr:unnamed protein product [Clonostachys rosea]